MRIRMPVLCLVSFISLLFAASLAVGAELRVYVGDQDGKPVADAVVTAMPVDTSKMQNIKPPDEVDQVDKEFVPRVKAVYVGSLVYFPNNDNIRHHVYSFSPAKVFELPLYKGKTAPPVLFDKPGVVVLGCNIHDWMLGFIYVSDTPFFAKTQQDGMADLKGLPVGEYKLRLWHPGMGNSYVEGGRNATVTDGATVKIDWQTALRSVFKIPRASPNQGTHYH